MLFQHNVEVGASETKGADAGTAHAVRRDVPWLQLGVDVERRVREVDLRTGMFAVQTGWQHLVAQGQRSFQNSRSSRSSFQVPDVRLDRAESHRPLRQIRTT